MARYNSVNSTSSVAQGSTISTPYSGLLTTITTGSGSVALPNPTLYTGSVQTFYNATATAVTLTTPSGNITGPGTGGTTSLTLPVGSIITIVSDGTNYIAQAWMGGPISATAITASGTITANSAVAFNPSNANISIQPSGTGTVTINPAAVGTIDKMNIGATTPGTGVFTSLSATGAYPQLILTNPSAGSGTTIKLVDSTTYRQQIGHIDSTTKFQIATGGTDASGTGLTLAMTIDASQRVGIGTNAPNYAVSIGNGGSIGLQTSSNSYSRILATPSQWGYSAGYRTIILGSTSTSYNTDVSGAVTLSFGVDVSGNANGSFTGDGRELIFRNVASFITPNSGNNGYLTPLAFNNGNVAIGSTSTAVSLDISTRTDAIALPKGTTAQRPASPTAGMTRFNTTDNRFECYDGSNWIQLKPTITATGGTVISSGGFTTHVFTTSGTFTVTAGSGIAEVLVVAGGGGGGWDVGGGGGAGGCLYTTGVALSAGTYTVTVGGGGTGATSGSGTAGGGSNSSFPSYTAIGGGGGGNWSGGSGASGGSGGGATSNVSGGGGSGTSGQGNNGGAAAGNTGNGNEYSGASGGGGAGAAGGNGTASGWSANSASYGYGGIGKTDAQLNGLLTAASAGELVVATRYIAGGGSSSSDNSSYYGQRGYGGGGQGGSSGATLAGIDNTGGGGGGGGLGGGSNVGGNGGRGIVIIRY